MKRYELVKGYPRGPKVGTIVFDDDGLFITKDGTFGITKKLIDEWPNFWKDVDRDKRTMVQRLRDHLDTPEGKASMDKFFAKLENDNQRFERNYQRFSRMVDHNGLENLMDKIQDKYNSDSYVKREYSLGYQPREDLNYLAYEYFKEHGTETQEGVNEFMECNFKIDNYLVGMMHGQGSYVKVQKKN